MGRRLADRAAPPRGDLLARFRAERAARREEQELLSRLAVPVEPGPAIPLARAPEVGAALAGALGEPVPTPGLLPLRDLLGMIGAHQWRLRGVEVPALGGRIHPWYGVFAPIRPDQVALVAEAIRRWPPAGRRALDVGTGTGVLALLLARAGARVVATDLSPRALACARENAARLGLADRLELVQADLFAGGPHDLVVANPPWLPAPAVTPLERAVYDPGGAFLSGLLAGLPARLAPGGEAWLVLSDLAERIGLRRPGELDGAIAAAGLREVDRIDRPAAHPRSCDRTDPLHEARAAEITSLRRLAAGTPRRAP